MGTCSARSICQCEDAVGVDTVLRRDKVNMCEGDTSSYGIGSVLMQDHGGGRMKPVAFCSRMLTPADQRYVHIEKECLATVWACETFDRFLYGLAEFKMLTCHKPLVPLINAIYIDKTPLRYQQLLMRLMRFKAKVKYAPGKDLVVADALSSQTYQSHPRRWPSCGPPRWTTLLFSQLSSTR